MQSELWTDSRMSQSKITKLLNSKTSKTRGTGVGTDNQIYTDDLLFHSFNTVHHLLHGPKTTRLNKIHTSRIKSPLSEGNLIPIWRNNFGHILLDSMVDSPLCTEVITNLINSNLIYNMLDIFILDTKL